MVVEVIHVEDIFELVSLVLFLIISWTYRILAHEEDQYTDFLSIAGGAGVEISPLGNLKNKITPKWPPLKSITATITPSFMSTTTASPTVDVVEVEVEVEIATGVLGQTAVTAYFLSKQLLLFDFADQ